MSVTGKTKNLNYKNISDRVASDEHLTAKSLRLPNEEFPLGRKNSSAHKTAFIQIYSSSEAQTPDSEK